MYQLAKKTCANYMNIFHKTKVQMVILRCYIGLKPQLPRIKTYLNIGSNSALSNSFPYAIAVVKEFTVLKELPQKFALVKEFPKKIALVSKTFLKCSIKSQ